MRICGGAVPPPRSSALLSYWSESVYGVHKFRRVCSLVQSESLEAGYSRRPPGSVLSGREVKISASGEYYSFWLCQCAGEISFRLGAENRLSRKPPVRVPGPAPPVAATVPSTAHRSIVHHPARRSARHHTRRLGATGAGVWHNKIALLL